MEKQKAPINPMNGDMVGTATANKTAAVTKTVLKITQISVFWIYLENLEWREKEHVKDFIPHDIVDKEWALCEL